MFKDKTLVIGFDGPDNVGKDTQIELLRKAFPDRVFSILDQNAPVGNTIEEKQKYGMKMLKEFEDNVKLLSENGKNLILNRTHYSEYSYGMTFRDMYNNTEYMKEVLKTDMNLFNFLKEKEDIILIIFVFSDKPTNIAERDDGKSLYTPEQLNLIESLVFNFKAISTLSELSHVTIDIESLGILDVHNLIKTTLDSINAYGVKDIKIQ